MVCQYHLCFSSIARAHDLADDSSPLLAMAAVHATLNHLLQAANPIRSDGGVAIIKFIIIKEVKT